MSRWSALRVLTIGVAAVLGVIFIAGPPAPSPAQTPPPIVLKMGHWVGPKAVFAKAIDWYLAEAERRTEGRLRFERYWAGSLAPGPELLDALESGIADVAAVFPAYFPGKTPLHNYGQLPCIGDDVWVRNMAARDLHNTVPELQKELDKFNTMILFYASTSSYGILSSTPVRSLEDFKGKRLRVAGEQAKLLGALGAVPVGMQAPEIYTAVERRTIDGTLFSPSGVTAYGLQDVAKYYSTWDVSGPMVYLGINKTVWNRLPRDIQQILMDVQLKGMESYHRLYQIEGDGESLELMRRAKVEIYKVPREHRARTQTICQEQLLRPWAERMESRGLPGRRVLEVFQERVAAYERQNPFASR